MRLVDQWETIAATLPAGWDDVPLTLTTEQPGELSRAAQVLAPMNAGIVGDSLVLHVRRAGGASGPEAAKRLFARLDADRVWCLLTPGEVHAAPPAQETPAVSAAETLAAQWDVCLEGLPPDWSDLLCELAVQSSTLLPRAALLCAPINPTRQRGRVGFTFRCARRSGYGVSPAMARRCFERMDAEEISGTVAVARVLADTHNVGTQGPVWVLDGRVL